MRRERVVGPMSRWQPFRWVLADVVMHNELPAWAGADLQQPGQPVAIEPADDGHDGMHDRPSHWLFGGFEVVLHREDAEGYYLNLTSPQPCFWVMWRLENETADDAMPQPMIVTLSYHDAGRWLDAQERVDQVPAPVAVVDWLARFAEQHFQPEPKKRKRPASFQPLADRFGNPVSISTSKIRGGGGAHGG